MYKHATSWVITSLVRLEMQEQQAVVALALVAEHCSHEAIRRGHELHEVHVMAVTKSIVSRRLCLAANKWAFEALDPFFVPSTIQSLLQGERTDIHRDASELIRHRQQHRHRANLDFQAHDDFEAYALKTAWPIVVRRIVTLLTHRKAVASSPNVPHKPVLAALVKTLPALASLVDESVRSLEDVKTARRSFDDAVAALNAIQSV